MPRETPSYLLTLATVAANAGATGIVCLDVAAEGRTFRLHAFRPGPEQNRRLYAMSDGSRRWLTRDGFLAACQASPRAERSAWKGNLKPTADLPSGAAHAIAPVTDGPTLIRVDISGPLEQRAGYHDPCGGYSDGHDAVADRLCAAFADGDVLLVVDSPGGAAAGLQQALQRAQEAKAKHGRHCTGFADEQIGSAAIWWALGICDEVFIPEAGQIGSIGARGAHKSIAAQLAKDGVEFTYFVWPNVGKIAFAPEFPLSPEARARGDRDVAIAGEAFCAAVCDSTIGKRHGLTPEAIAALSADMLTGQAAVDAGLCDGVADLETVTRYALTLADGGADSATTTGAAGASKGRAMSLNARAEGEKPGDGDGEEEEKAKGTKPDGVCKSCGTGNPVAHKFCAQCGGSMAAPPIDDPAEGPPSSKPATRVPPKAVGLDASIAEILGAANDSPLAIKTAALEWRNRAALATGKDSPTAILAALGTMPAKIDRLATLEKSANESDGKERFALAHRLVKTGVKRDRVLLDVIEDGQRKGVKLAEKYARMDLAQFRADVEAAEEDSAPPRRNPFEPDRVASQAASGAPAGATLDADGKPTKEAIEAAKKSPAVLRMFNATGNRRTLDALAEQYVIAAAQNGASLGGAQ